MLLILHVVIDIDLDRLDIDIAIRLRRQGFEGRFIELLERIPAVARQLLERFLIQLIKQAADTLVQLGQREKGVMAKPRQDPALDNLHCHLGFGFIFRLIRPRRHHRHLVMLRPLLITGVEIGS